MITSLVEVTWYNPTNIPQETCQWLLSICGGRGMGVWFSLIPEQAITMVTHAKFRAVYGWFKKKGKHIFSLFFCDTLTFVWLWVCWHWLPNYLTQFKQNKRTRKTASCLYPSHIRFTGISHCLNVRGASRCKIWCYKSPKLDDCVR